MHVRIRYLRGRGARGRRLCPRPHAWPPAAAEPAPRRAPARPAARRSRAAPWSSPTRASRSTSTRRSTGRATAGRSSIACSTPCSPTRAARRPPAPSWSPTWPPSATANGGITNGGKTYIFHLRQGIKFAPPVNREVTAQDFKYSFERMMNPKTHAHAARHGLLHEHRRAPRRSTTARPASITGFKTPDKYTVADRPRPSPMPPSSARSPCRSPTSCPRSGCSSGASSSCGTRWAPAPTCSTTGRPAQRDRAQAQPQLDRLARRRPGLGRRDQVQVVDRPVHRAAHAGARRERRARRLHRAVRLRRRHQRPRVEEPGRRRAGHRHRLPVHERADEAVRQPPGAAGDQLGHRPPEDRQAGLRRRQPARPDLPRRPARPRRRRRAASSTATTRPRPSSCSPRPATPTASRRPSTRTTSTPGPRSSSRSRTTSAQIGIKADVKLLDRATYWTLIGTAGQGRARPAGLVAGLPRPVRLRRAAVQQEQRRRGRRQPELLVGPDRRDAAQSELRACPTRRSA